jgi:hypothetical protein
MKFKKCRSCYQLKPFSEFRKSDQSSTGYRVICKNCENPDWKEKTKRDLEAEPKFWNINEDAIYLL